MRCSMVRHRIILFFSDAVEICPRVELREPAYVPCHGSFVLFCFRDLTHNNVPGNNYLVISTWYQVKSFFLLRSQGG